MNNGFLAYSVKGQELMVESRIQVIARQIEERCRDVKAVMCSMVRVRFEDANSVDGLGVILRCVLEANKFPNMTSRLDQICSIK